MYKCILRTACSPIGYETHVPQKRIHWMRADPLGVDSDVLLHIYFIILADTDGILKVKSSSSHSQTRTHGNFQHFNLIQHVSTSLQSVLQSRKHYWLFLAKNYIICTLSRNWFCPKSRRSDSDIINYRFLCIAVNGCTKEGTDKRPSIHEKSSLSASGKLNWIEADFCNKMD